jgi:hypothetical protein
MTPPSSDAVTRNACAGDDAVRAYEPTVMTAPSSAVFL